MSFFLRDRVEALLAEQMKRTITIAGQHLATITDVADRLLRGGRLVANDILETISVTSNRSPANLRCSEPRTIECPTS
jgi:hypothetical protein